MKTAIVLSGGGSLGAVQVGMLQSLARMNFLPDMVIGASVGALNGAFFADDPTPAGADRLAELWRGLRRDDVFPLTVLAGVKALVLGRDHLVESAALRTIARRALRMRRIEEARIPLHIVATDVLSGDEVLLSSGDVETALMASTAIPVVFPQVELAGRHLFDGGVANSTPIASAIACGAERIVVLPTGVSCAMREPPRNMAALALHVLSLQSMRQIDRDVERFALQAQITIVPPLCPLSVSMFDFSQTASLIERAAAQTRAWLAAQGLERTGPLHVPLAHHDRAAASAPIELPGPLQQAPRIAA
ncbi:MAG TPA: patatin-like phospholipase family protein [Casimicrobiaceae bacterium]|nr:patatin-like phospholipase family protein [Casimicrobiaceae bacterium]